MKKRRVKLGPLKIYSDEFRRARVKEFETGELTVNQICKMFGIKSTATVYNWIYKYSIYNKKGVKIVEMKESSTDKVKQLQKKVAELERLLGQKQIKLDYFETMAELAKEKYDIDLKKNSNTPQSKR